MPGFFDRMLGRGRSSRSAPKAKERLQFILVHDRIHLPADRLQAMKDEILAVISKYVQVDTDEVDIALEQRDRHSNKIVAEIPFSKSLVSADTDGIASDTLATSHATSSLDDDLASREAEGPID